VSTGRADYPRSGPNSEEGRRGFIHVGMRGKEIRFLVEDCAARFQRKEATNIHRGLSWVLGLQDWGLGGGDMRGETSQKKIAERMGSRKGADRTEEVSVKKRGRGR